MYFVMSGKIANFALKNHAVKDSDDEDGKRWTVR